PWTRPWLRVLQLHLCLVYFFSGISKIIGHTWRNGEALYKALGLPAMPPLFSLDGVMAALGEHPLIFLIGGWAVFLLELLYPAAVWYRPTNRIWLYGILMMHAATALLIGLYHFSALMLLLNYTAFASNLSPWVARR